MCELYEPLADEKRVSLGLDVESSVFAEGDRDLVFQVFANLMDNAIKFSPSGGKIDVVVQKEMDGISATLRDQGPGLSEPDLEKVFDRFYRADQSRTMPGNGLGLSLVKAIVAYHQGVIALRNTDPGLEVKIGFKQQKSNKITKS